MKHKLYNVSSNSHIKYKKVNYTQLIYAQVRDVLLVIRHRGDGETSGEVEETSGAFEYIWWSLLRENRKPTEGLTSYNLNKSYLI